ncbi:MAG TPA: hypothetical protein VEQ10_14280 [Vicinamibacteria bacterium]|nr:hypothetical protein [Vicinamibacteria bacterium]
MVVRGGLRWWVLVLGACGTLHGAGAVLAASAKSPPTAVPEARDVDTRLFLIGDAGVPLSKDPVLASLESEVTADSRHAVVVFLGDNIYPRGLPPKENVGRKEAERRIDAQVGAVRAEGATAIFIPGNHDWDRMSPGGWDAIRRQGEYLREKGGPSVSLEPEDGCPGPVVRDFNTTVRLVLLDTEWWLQPPPKPGPGSSCSTHTSSEVVDALAAALRDAGNRRVVVIGHHPLATGGEHGGHFSWEDHIFPLRATKSWLWIPLPGIGSAYPLSRMHGASAQDMSGALNRKMREALSGVMQRQTPLVYAAGHDHNLQVIDGKNVARYLLVSGAGAFGHVSATAWTRETLYAGALSGYMRVDFEKGGRARLAVVALHGERKAREVAAFDLSAEAAGQKPGVPHGVVAKPPEKLRQEAPQQTPGIPESQPAPTRPPDHQAPEEKDKQNPPPAIEWEEKKAR